MDHAGEYTSQWAAIESIATKIGCAAQMLHAWVKQAVRNQGLKPGPTSQKLEQRDREVRELRQALVPSVGSVGDSYDNALAETINGLYKA